MRSVAGGAGNAGGDDAVADSIELFGSGFQQTMSRGLAVDGIDHHLLGSDGFDGFEPGADEFLPSIVDH